MSVERGGEGRARDAAEPEGPANLFSDSAWSNGHYELLIDVGGGQPAPERVVEVGVALWSHPDLDGPYPSSAVDPRRQRRLDPASVSASARSYGIAATPPGTRVACGLYPLSSIPEFLPDGEPHPPDVVILYLPLASLISAWPGIGGFPFRAGQDTRPWQEPLEDWLAGIAAHVFALTGFRLGVIDFEVDVDYDAWRSWTPDTVPADRRLDLSLPTDTGLRRFRRTRWC